MTLKIISIIILLSTLKVIAQTPNKLSTIKIKRDNTDLLNGKKYYIQNCAICHDNPKLGPKLNGVTEKYSKQWVLDFTENNERLLNLKDKQAIKIWLAWKKAPMTVYEGGVTKKQLEDLYTYLKTLK